MLRGVLEYYKEIARSSEESKDASPASVAAASRWAVLQARSAVGAVTVVVGSVAPVKTQMRGLAAAALLATLLSTMLAGTSGQNISVTPAVVPGEIPTVLMVHFSAGGFVDHGNLTYCSILSVGNTFVGYQYRCAIRSVHDRWPRRVAVAAVVAVASDHLCLPRTIRHAGRSAITTRCTVPQPLSSTPPT